MVRIRSPGCRPARSAGLSGTTSRTHPYIFGIGLFPWEDADVDLCSDAKCSIAIQHSQGVLTKPFGNSAAHWGLSEHTCPQDGVLQGATSLSLSNNLSFILIAANHQSHDLFCHRY